MVGRGEIDLVHDQTLWINEARLSVEVGVTRALAVAVTLPARAVTTSIRYLDDTGAAVTLVDENIHHRDETVAGLGDPLVLGAATRRFGAWRVTGRAGASLPLGATVEDPYALGAMGLRHQHLQFGAGTVNPALGADATRTWGRWQLGAYALTQQAVYANRHGYQAGDRYAVGLSLRRRLGGPWSVRAGVDLAAESAERWHDQIPTDDGNRGRLDVIVGAGATRALGGGWSLDAALKVPVVTRVVGGQLAMPALLELGVAWTFGQAARAGDHDGRDHDGDAHDHDGHDHDGDAHDHDGDDHDHDAHDHDRDAHDHDAPPLDTAGLDVADLGPPGAAVALVPVPGKVTVFDFWAPWCQPCKQVEPALLDLARAHPDRVAIRRIDVVDWDSAAVATYLTPGGHGLPHVRVVDRAGQPVLERSSAPEQLDAFLAELRATITTAATDAPPASPAPPPTDTAPTTPPAPPPAPPAATTPVATPPPRRPRPPRPRVVPIRVTAAGFEPREVRVPAGRPIALRFLRTIANTCATEVIMTVDGKRLERALPLDQPTDLVVTFPRPGRITYACAMDMIGGAIVVE